MLKKFQTDTSTLDSTQLFRKYILGGNCYVFDEEKHFRLREEICEYFHVEFNDIVLVGSGKLGFSVKSSKRYVAFGEESDIDIAVVSTKLFQQVWEESYLYKKSGAYWPASKAFFRYLAEGWIRPDKLPTSQYFKFTTKWWHFFNELTASGKYGPYKVRAGLYQSFFFLQEYQKICMEQCIEELN